ncbi:cache domain-containing sensor histidine kinase [Butyrivibrio sp. M55]|uniref:cache domain-containing sensor histidine kinase n=1 Tax=Butyrivibrio sp. M55 TaxID=1855323 RepID=UPI0008EB906A|nr:sensor histidine kinase [Butyrivibrio sp. M55]SFU90136.1 two-component system, sensor histidine kinase YesM [Butyrivibrio sp. M55]
MIDQVGDKLKKTTLSSSFRSTMIGIVMIVFVSFLISTYIITEKERKAYVIRESESVLKALSNNISSDLKNYMDVSRLVITDRRLVTFLKADLSAVDENMTNDARYGMMDILNAAEGVDSVMAFREDEKMVSTNRISYEYDDTLMNSREWRDTIYSNEGRATVTLNCGGVARRIDDKPLVTIERAINDINSQKRIGIMMMNISSNVFQDMLNKLRYDNICILGADGCFIAGNEGYLNYYSPGFAVGGIKNKNIKVDNKRMLLSACCVDNYPIVIMRVSKYGTEGIPYGILYVLMVLLLVFVVLAIHMGIFIKTDITDPIYKLSESMEKNKRTGDLKTIDIDMPSSELEMLKDDYNNLIDHVNELIGTLIEKEKTLQRAEMRVLQEQIKPHFLYNSLETIGFLALDAGAVKVHDSLEVLGSFYRNFLSKGDRVIPLSREVQIVKDYLALQKLRYGDIFEDEYDIDEKTNKFILPKLILQPLVENSIYHGIRMKGEKGSIKISSKLEDGFLHLKVRDTGVGMTQDQIDKILHSDRNFKGEIEGESFGLWGTIERIRIYCGSNDVVRIDSEVGEYTEIEFIISEEMAIRGVSDGQKV